MAAAKKKQRQRLKISKGFHRRHEWRRGVSSRVRLFLLQPIARNRKYRNFCCWCIDDNHCFATCLNFSVKETSQPSPNDKNLEKTRSTFYTARSRHNNNVTTHCADKCRQSSLSNNFFFGCCLEIYELRLLTGLFSFEGKKSRAFRVPFDKMSEEWWRFTVVRIYRFFTRAALGHPSPLASTNFLRQLNVHKSMYKLMRSLKWWPLISIGPALCCCWIYIWTAR